MSKTLTFMLISSVLAVSVHAQPSLIEPKAARDMLAGSSKAVLLDVRTREEFVSGRIAGSVLLPYDRIDAAGAARILDSKDRPVIVYCRTGRRSSIAASTLFRLGYTRVYDLGGIDSWPFGTIRGEP